MLERKPLSRYCPMELAVAENTLFALPPINRIVPTTKTKMTASITAYSAISCPSSCDQSLRRKSPIFAPPCHSFKFYTSTDPPVHESTIGTDDSRIRSAQRSLALCGGEARLAHPFGPCFANTPAGRPELPFCCASSALPNHTVDRPTTVVTDIERAVCSNHQSYGPSLPLASASLARRKPTSDEILHCLRLSAIINVDDNQPNTVELDPSFIANRQPRIASPNSFLGRRACLAERSGFRGRIPSLPLVQPKAECCASSKPRAVAQ